VASQDDAGANAASPQARYRLEHWSRILWAMALLFGSLPVASRLLLGGWGFEAAAEIAILCAFLGTYFYIAGWRRFRTIPDAATMIEQALQLASTGETGEAIALLTHAIRLSPRLWQTYQYRGALHLAQPAAEEALQDLAEAIRLAPMEPSLYWLRAQAYTLLGDASAAQRDQETAAALQAAIGKNQ
jgi:tetratricopeptide (TPR) repeat protein